MLQMQNERKKMHKMNQESKQEGKKKGNYLSWNKIKTDYHVKT